jgi:hypothetical protein
MATTRYDGISIGDQVMIVCCARSHHFVREKRGMIGEVVSRDRDDISLNLGHGCRLLVSRNDVVRYDMALAV